MASTRERTSSGTSRSRQRTARSHQRIAMLATLTIEGQVAFLASMMLLPAVSEYSLVGDYVSELAIGRYGIIQRVASVLVGLGTLALAFVIFALSAGVPGSRVGSVLIAAHGAGAILAAIFPTERVDTAADVWSQSTPGLIHAGVSIVSFICVIVGMLILTWTFARAALWRSLATWSGLLASGALALMFVQAEGPWVGLMQRLLIGTTAAWMILVAVRARSIAKAECAAGEKVRVPRAA